MFITPHIDRLIDLALEEDLGRGDITTGLLVGEEEMGRGEVLAREELVVAGMAIFGRVFQRLDPTIELEVFAGEGERVAAGAELGHMRGPLVALLAGERTALNFLQRLSGVATHTRRFVEAAGGVRVVDTRKTTPGWRALEKYATALGGAGNHRAGLDSGILIKDNHIAACGSVGRALDLAKARAPHLLKVEVEVTSRGELEEALDHGAEVILLDNMSLGQIEEAVRLVAGRAVLEVSGGVRLESLPALARTGVDLVSVGALTHGARGVDISLELIAEEAESQTL